MQYQCLVFLLLLLLSVKLLSAEFAAVGELSAEKFNGTKRNKERKLRPNMQTFSRFSKYSRIKLYGLSGRLEHNLMMQSFKM